MVFGLSEIFKRPEVSDFRNDDEIEEAIGKVGGDGTIGERDLRERLAAVAGHVEGKVGNVEAEERFAFGGELRRKDSYGTAYFESARIARTGKRRDSSGVLFSFIRARFEVPRVDVFGVDIVEILRWEGVGHRRSNSISAGWMVLRAKVGGVLICF